LKGESSGHAQILADSDAILPPIVVHRATMRVIDGMHRLRAAALRGEDQIDVCFFEGDEKDAFVLAVQTNVAHGLPLSLEDRTAAASRILASHPTWSDRSIAAVSGLAAKTIAGIRKRSTDDDPQLNTRIGRDGRARPLNSAEGRLRAFEVLQDNPSASLREVATVVGVSPGTVRDVRQRMARGDDPVPSQNLRPPTVLVQASRARPGGPAVERDLMATLQTIRKDPSLRFTESGRTLLRLLDAHAVVESTWGQVVDNVPLHSAGMIAELVRHCAGNLIGFANQLDRRGESTG
jgi:hypothetical protein